MAGRHKAPGVVLVPAPGGGLVIQAACSVVCPACKKPVALAAGTTPAQIQAELAKPCPH